MREPSLTRVCGLAANTASRSRVLPLRTVPRQVGGSVKRAKRYGEVTGLFSPIALDRWSRLPSKDQEPAETPATVLVAATATGPREGTRRQLTD